MNAEYGFAVILLEYSPALWTWLFFGMPETISGIKMTQF